MAPVQVSHAAYPYNRTFQREGAPGTSATASIRRCEVISALSFALDLSEGRPLGHSVRSCVFGMSIADEIGIPRKTQGDLFYALLMKDAGCSSNAAGCNFNAAGCNFEDTGSPSLDSAKLRAGRGASIAGRMGLSETTASAIYSCAESWDGAGHPQGLRGNEIPLFSRIMKLAQTVDVAYAAYGPEAAIRAAMAGSGSAFDPAMTRAFHSVAKRRSLWIDLRQANVFVGELAPVEDLIEADDQAIDNICQAFADIIDAKSPFTYQHSTGVAAVSVAIAEIMGLPKAKIQVLRRAALLHDIGKLSVPNHILDKPEKLTSTEWQTVRNHPFYSFEILKRAPGFEELCEIAACHHERLDGSGYFRHLTAEQLSTPARILAVADIFEALASERPYRAALPIETVFSIMEKDAPHAIDAECLEAIRQSRYSVM